MQATKPWVQESFSGTKTWSVSATHTHEACRPHTLRAAHEALILVFERAHYGSQSLFLSVLQDVVLGDGLQGEGGSGGLQYQHVVLLHPFILFLLISFTESSYMERAL
jgi:hypothetical protein